MQEVEWVVYRAIKKPSPNHRPGFEPLYSNSGQQPECSSQQHNGLTNDDCSDERSNNNNGQVMIGKACLKTWPMV